MLSVLETTPPTKLARVTETERVQTSQLRRVSDWAERLGVAALCCGVGSIFPQLRPSKLISPLSSRHPIQILDIGVKSILQHCNERCAHLFSRWIANLYGVIEPQPPFSEQSGIKGRAQAVMDDENALAVRARTSRYLRARAKSARVSAKRLM